MRNEKVGFKIREHTLQRVPYILVAGDQEVNDGTMNVRARGGDNLGGYSFDALMDLLMRDISCLGRSQTLTQ